jgi:hypothetical protein
MSDEITLNPVVDFNRMCQIMGVANARPELDENSLAELPDGEHDLFLNTVGIRASKVDGGLPRFFSYWKKENMMKSASLSYSLKQESVALLTGHLVRLNLDEYLLDPKELAEISNSKNVWEAIGKSIVGRMEPVSYSKVKLQANCLTITATVTTDANGYKILA